MQLTSATRSALISLFCMSFLSNPVNAVEQQKVTIGTGGVTGVYYPAGSAICRLVNKGRRDHGTRCMVKATEGSVENVTAIRNNDLEFAIVQSDVQFEAYLGQGRFHTTGPDNSLRSVLSLHAEPLHVMVNRKSQILTVDDLPGHRINIGRTGSGSRVLADLIFQAKGWQMSQFESLETLKSVQQGAAICSQRIDVSIWAAGLPNGVAKEAASSCNIAFLPLTGEWVDTLLQNHSAYSPATIPANLYRGNPESIATFGPRATLITRTDMNNEVVYAVTKSVFKNIDSFKRLHPALKNLKYSLMIHAGLTAPLHPGAIRFYKEQSWPVVNPPSTHSTE